MAGNDDDSGKYDGDGFPDATLPSGDEGPSPVAGVDWQTFRNFVTRALNGDDTIPATILNRVNAALHSGETDLEKKNSRWWQDFIFQQMIAENLRAIDDLIDKYNEMADVHHEQAEKARARMQEAADKLEEIGNFIDGANEVFNEKDKTGRFDREKATRLLQSRGVQVDPHTDDRTLLAELARQKEKALRERTMWSEEYGSAEADAKRHTDLEEENRRKAEELIQRRDAIRSGGLDAEEEALRLREIAEEYETDVRLKAAKIEKERQPDQPAASLNEASLAVAKVSQASQAASEVSEFETLTAGVLKQEFTQAANTIQQPPAPERPKPNSPTLSV